MKFFRKKENKPTNLHDNEVERTPKAERSNIQPSELDSHESESWSDKAGVLNNSGSFEEAIKCCNKALELNPQNGDAWYNKGASLAPLGRYNEAIKCYDKALELNSQDYQAWGNKAASLNKLGRFEEAVKCCNKALELDPQNIVALKNKAIAEEARSVRKPSEFVVDTRAYDVSIGNNGTINGFTVHLGKIDLNIQIMCGRKSEVKTFSALLVWLPKNAKKVKELLKSNKVSFKGKLNINIFSLSDFIDGVGDMLVSKGGWNIEEFKTEVIRVGINPFIRLKDISLVVKDDFEVDYLRDDNYIEQNVFAMTVHSLLVLLCRLDPAEAYNTSREFTNARIQLKPKISTDEVALDLINLKIKK